MTVPARVSTLDLPPHLRARLQSPTERHTMAQQKTTSARTAAVLNDVDQVLAVAKAETPSMAVEPTTEERVHALAVEALDHELQAKEHAAAAKAAKEKLRDLLDFGTVDSGNLKITVSRPASRFNQAKFAAAFPAEVNPGLYKSVLDTSAIPPKLKTEYTDPGTGNGAVVIK